MPYEEKPPMATAPSTDDQAKRVMTLSFTKRPRAAARYSTASDATREEGAKQVIDLAVLPPKLRSELAKFDANGDGFLDVTELDISAVDYVQKTEQVFILRKVLIATFIGILLFGAAVFGLVFSVVALTKDTKAINNDDNTAVVLTNRKGDKVVQTAGFSQTHPVSSVLPDEAFLQLKQLKIISQETASWVVVDVIASARTMGAGTYGSVMQIVTAIGSITLDGTSMEFTDGMTSLFEDAGFEVHPAAYVDVSSNSDVSGNSDTYGRTRRQRRRLMQTGGVSLSGVFNYIAQYDITTLQNTATTTRTYSVTLTPPITPLGTTAQTLGINSGHSFGASPIMYLKRLGINGARIFGGSGGIKPRTLVGADFGKALNGTLVNSKQLFIDAVNQLRSPNGHNPAMNTTWAKPPLYYAYDNALAFVDVKDPSGNSILNQVQSLQAANIEPMLVQWTPCGSFAFNTYVATNASYYGERWELYKHQYVLAMWAWKHGVRKIEFWNEPDLNAACINPTTTLNATQWRHYQVVLQNAIYDAFADLNADFTSGTVACGSSTLPCPLAPIVPASAFAKSSFCTSTDTGTGMYPPCAYLGYPTVADEHTVFPDFVNSSTAQLVSAYSMHSYGKSGYLFKQLLQGLASSIAVVHKPAAGGPAVLPVIITEHAAHTSGDWNAMESHADFPYEATHLAQQALRAATMNVETYVFKFSATNSTNGGIAKTGIHFGENYQYPFPIGDTTLSAEALRLVATATVGGKTLEMQIRDSTSYPSEYSLVGTYLASQGQRSLVGAVTRDATRRYLVFINDCQDMSGKAIYCKDPGTGTSNTTAVSLQLNLANWGLPAGTVLPISMVSADRYGEISDVEALPANGTLTIKSPANSVILLVAPVSKLAQTVTAISPSSDATIYAASSTNTGSATTLTVCTSNTANHATTAVALLSFNVPAGATIASGLTSALLELVLVTPILSTAKPMIMSVFGSQCNTAWSEVDVTWLSATSFAVVGGATMTTAITSVTQNFAPADMSTSSLVGHITVTANATGGTRFAVDVSDYVSSCAGGTATFVIVRRFRNNIYVGNTGGTVPADSLSSGASVQFQSKEAADTTVRPVLRLLQSALQ